MANRYTCIFDTGGTLFSSLTVSFLSGVVKFVIIQDAFPSSQPLGGSSESFLAASFLFFAAATATPNHSKVTMGPVT